MLEEQLRLALEKRKERGILRGLKHFPTIHNDDNSSTKSVGEQNESTKSELVDFSSNDYMGLGRSNSIKERYMKKMQNQKNLHIGSTGSRLLDGNSVLHEEVENQLLQHFNAQSALLFNSGYDANSSLLAFLPQPNDVILFDELVHASVHDGMRSSRIPSSKRISFKHNDLGDFTQKLEHIWMTFCQNESLSNVFIAVESVYSMDGDICPLRELVTILNERIPTKRRCLIVDEAHAVGLYGINGSGICELMGVHTSVDVRLATFGKAFGCSGAAVLTSPIIRLYLINYARPLIYSTALAHPSLIAIKNALDVLSTPDGTLRARQTFMLTQLFIDQLQDLVDKMKEKEGSMNIQLPLDVQRRLETAHTPTVKSSSTSNGTIDLIDIPPPPIVPILTVYARDLANHLISNGYLVRPINYPTVPRGSERVRICIHAHNTQEEVLGMVNCVAKWIEARKFSSGTGSVNNQQSISMQTLFQIEKSKL